MKQPASAVIIRRPERLEHPMDRARRIPSAESDTPRRMATKLERLDRADTHGHGFRQ